MHALDTTVADADADCAVCVAAVDGLWVGDKDTVELAQALDEEHAVARGEGDALCDAVVQGDTESDGVAEEHVDGEVESEPVGDCVPDALVLRDADTDVDIVALAAIVGDRVGVHVPDGERLGVDVAVAHCELDAQSVPETVAETLVDREGENVIEGESENEPVPLPVSETDCVSESDCDVQADCVGESVSEGDSDGDVVDEAHCEGEAVPDEHCEAVGESDGDMEREAVQDKVEVPEPGVG